METKKRYLKVIYELCKENEYSETDKKKKKGARVIDIADKLSINKASVSEMLKKLKNNGLVKFEPYSNIQLTVKGKHRAEKITQKHEIIRDFLKHSLKHEHNYAHKEAHLILHNISDESVKRMLKIMKGQGLSEYTKPPSYVG